MSGMNFTEAQFEELQKNLRGAGSVAENSVVGPRPLSSGSRKSKPEPFEGPVDVTLVLYGHCPVKKNTWSTGPTGRVFIPESVAEQISTLTMQAFHGWSAAGMRAPVEHPEMTIKFFVRDARQDEDGKWTTVLDCLQKAGVLVNDNLRRNNGRKVHETAEFVSASDERVEIRVVKR